LRVLQQLDCVVSSPASDLQQRLSACIDDVQCWIQSKAVVPFQNKSILKNFILTWNHV